MTRILAEALAERLWTYDGRPYRELSFQGSCDEGGPGRCELTVTGLPRFAPTIDSSDYYSWAVSLPSGLLTSVGRPQLVGYPPELTPALDALVRSLDTTGQVANKTLLGVEWAIPPPEDAFVLRYGEGEEEGDPTLYVTVDRQSKQILSVSGD